MLVFRAVRLDLIFAQQSEMNRIYMGKMFMERMSPFDFYADILVVVDNKIEQGWSKYIYA
jgi:hypothetical protein